METRIASLERRVTQLERRSAGLSPSAAPPSIDHRTLVVIAAAVAATGYGRIKSVAPIVHPSRADLWVSHGRREHLYSHRVR